MAHNPTVEAPKRAKEADLIPMGMTELQLAVPEIPGFHLYWFADRPGRIARAQRQGWVFVMDDEVEVMNFKTVAGSVAESGNADLGGRVSLYGGTNDQGQAFNLYLMKIPEEKWTELEAFREAQADRTIAALRGGQAQAPDGTMQGDQSQRYSPKVIKNTVFEKKRKR